VVSVGELNALRPVIEALLTLPPEGIAVNVVLTTTTKTAQGLARACYPNLPITYFPLDVWPCVASAFNTIKPTVLVVAETELWPNVLWVAHATGCKVVLANARLSDASFRSYRRIKPFMAQCLACVDEVLAQSEADAQRYRELGAPKVACLGNLKFDQPVEQALPPVHSPLQQCLGWSQLDEVPVLVFASTFNGEEADLFTVYQQLLVTFPTLRLLIAPRHPERLPEVQALANAAGLRFSIRSQLSEASPNRHPVVIVDTIGELNDVYRLATVAVVCGSFTTKRRGQNPLEPLRLGIPTVFGPHMENFKAVVQAILAEQAATQVTSYDDLALLLHQWLAKPDQLTTMTLRTTALFKAHGGGSAKTVGVIKRLLAPSVF
jgi:3-deoxy-D-manno-octulosonic-acid transferase